MRKLLIVGVVLALFLTGCGGRKAENTVPESPVPESSVVEEREERVQLEFTVEGMEEQVPAALYIGEGYSIYIPEEGWTHERETDRHITEDSWESAQNDEVALRVLRYGVYPDASITETKSHFVRESGYLFEDLMGGDWGDPLTGTDEEGDLLGFMTAEGTEGATYVVAWEYPAEAAEGFGARLPQIAATFAATK